MTDNEHSTSSNLNGSPLLIEILRELREIREQQEVIRKAQEDAEQKRGRIFRYLTRIQPPEPSAYNRPRIDYGAIADFRARSSRLRP